MDILFVGWGGVELNSFVCCANLDGLRFTVFCLIALLLNGTCASWLLFDLKVSLAGFLCVCVSGLISIRLGLSFNNMNHFRSGVILSL